MLPIPLEGQVGIVTGAGSALGIGRSLVLSAVKAGAVAVYACDLHVNFRDALISGANKINPKCKVETRLLDVSSEQATLEVLRDILKTHGRLDFFFANAGYAKYRSLDDLTTAQFERAFAVMQMGVFLAIKYGAQAMSFTSSTKPKPKGAIVVTSSIGAISGAVTDLAYSSVKAACHGMIANASVQLSTSNIRINCIAPGFTQTSIHSNAARAEDGVEGFAGLQNEDNSTQVKQDQDAFFKSSGMTGENAVYYYNRIALPEEIAHLGLFLASDLAAAVNGTVIVADSGRLAAGQGAGLFGPTTPVKALDL
ncbi:uncharacterized protein Z520_02000 [Fonsecaea multimorphosa CBS 102226]|uniref:Uncharacterized protein n=1 Tax=Fonsecaea multimorphosa CBS 102226 TaxID=1442371 RepID=A0A0D2IXW3_9EURO|nr:uncharacterized protein Z520_02000 [Fonsecaea multimorphosa CBS 102226]KIY01862.1 hypothetical protein Z520_02000 [Fonsecaea multimorphosa CBS 102226]OAL29547.1 hypothetical protein AYO22_01961 [Fonsecaea multimorphosa]